MCAGVALLTERQGGASGLSISFVSEVCAALAGTAPSPFPTTSIWNPAEKKSFRFSSYGQARRVPFIGKLL